MCGIAGRVNFASGAPVAPATVRAMCDLIAHRGPDGHGVYCDGAVGFGHRRLAIIDLSPGGAQPMQTRRRRAGHHLQRRDLQLPRAEGRARRHGPRVPQRERHRGDPRRLSRVGHRVRRAARRDVRAGALGRAAAAAVHRPRSAGQEAAALPLDRDGLAFASEPKAFLAEPGFTREVDLQAISHYLSLAVRAGAAVGLQGRDQAAAGALRSIVEDGRVSVQRYWRLSLRAAASTCRRRRGDDGLTARLRTAVRPAADQRRAARRVPERRHRLRPGRVVHGRAVAAACARSRSASAKRTTTSCRPPGWSPSATRPSTPSSWSSRMPLDLLPQLVWHYGEPFGDSSALPTYILSELTRRHVTVALNGDAGDENFAGYDRYLASEMAAPGRCRAAGRSASWWRRPRRRRGRRIAQPHRPPRPPLPRQAGRVAEPALRGVDDLLRRRTQGAAGHAGAARRRHRRRRGRCSNGPSTPRTRRRRSSARSNVDVTTYLPDDLLVKVDIATMAHGLEGRSPLLDHHVMEYAARLPARFKVRGGEQEVAAAPAGPQAPAAVAGDAAQEGLRRADRSLVPRRAAGLRPRRAARLGGRRRAATTRCRSCGACSTNTPPASANGIRSCGRC